MKNMSKSGTIIIVSILLLLTFGMGLKFSYDLGFVTAGDNICKPLSFGITTEQKYVCFDKTESQNNMLPDYNLSFEVIQ